MNDTPIQIEQGPAPAWADVLTAPNATIIREAFSGAVCVDNEWYFSGVIGGFQRKLKVPSSIDIHYDLDVGTCFAKLEFPDTPDSDEPSVLYAPFEEIDFALLWNERPNTVHGLPGDRITLLLTPGDWSRPVVIAGDIPAQLGFQTEAQRFAITRIPFGRIRKAFNSIKPDEFDLPSYLKQAEAA